MMPVLAEQGTGVAELLRFATAGSVDDGKSTLIGRLLFDAKGAFEDQLEQVEEASRRAGDGYTNLALLTDGLRAEREQGITIDVAYRYFATPKRRFIIADTPGHIQYTRNMVTGASTADLSVVLVDARNGMVEQSKRHACIASLLGIPHLVVCVNKMDLVDWDQETFEEIEAEFRDFAALLGVPEITVIPISALEGDNVVEESEQHALVRRPIGARAPGNGSDRVGSKRGGRSVPGSVRDSPDVRRTPRLPRLRRATRQWRAAPGRSGRGSPIRARDAYRRDRHLRR